MAILAKIDLPTGFSLETKNLHTSINASAFDFDTTNAILVRGSLQSGGSISLDFTMRANQAGPFSLKLSNSLLLGDNSLNSDDDAQIDGVVGVQVAPPTFTYSIGADSALNLI